MFNYIKLKNLRNNANMVQSQLAEKLNISPSTIAMYETGKRQPDSETIVKIATLFGVSTDYLLDNEPSLKLTYEDLDKLPVVQMTPEEALQSILDIIESRDWDEDKKEHYRQDIKYAFKDNK